MAIASYTIEQLTEAVRTSVSYSEVCRKIGIFPRGASWEWIKKKIKKLNLDTSHFLGKAAVAGPRGRGKASKLAPEKILVEGKTQRAPPFLLRRALLEIGRPYECEDCGNKGEWRGKKLLLEIDHQNGDWSDCRKENVGFVCPNCHGLRTYPNPESKFHG